MVLKHKPALLLKMPALGKMVACKNLQILKMAADMTQFGVKCLGYHVPMRARSTHDDVFFTPRKIF